MDNFDLKKYLAEGKLGEVEIEGKDTFIDTIPNTKELIEWMRDLLNDLEGVETQKAAKEIAGQIKYYAEEIDMQVFDAGLDK